MALKLSRRTWLLVLFAVVAVAAIVLVGYHSWNVIPLEPPDPIPNGYDDLVAAGNMIQGGLDVGKATENELRQFVATNSAALARARLGLTRQCRVPAAAWSGSSNLTGHINDLASLKRMAYAFQAEGRSAELESRPKDAAASCLTIITEGIELSHGGVLMDALVAAATVSRGIDGLNEIVPKLSAVQSRLVARQLEKSVAEWEPKSEILRHEAMFRRKIAGSPLYIFNRILHLWRKLDEQALAKYDNQHRRMLALEIHLAAHAYELEQGRKAQGWGDLVPAYLKAIPQDPLTGTNFNTTGF